MDRIPFYAPGGQFICNLSLSEAETMKGATIRRNKRGHIKSVVQKALTCHVVRYGEIASYGEEFEQELTCHRVYALKGVRGSK